MLLSRAEVSQVAPSSYCWTDINAEEISHICNVPQELQPTSPIEMSQKPDLKQKETNK